MSNLFSSLGAFGKKFNPLGRVFLILAALVLIAGLGVQLVAGFGGSRLTDHRNDYYEWTGGTLLIEEDEPDGRASFKCQVEPEQGGQRDVSVGPSERDRPNYQRETYEPWFSGSAQVSCGDYVTVFTGTFADMRAFTQSRMYLWLGGGAVVVLLVLAFVVGRRRGAGQGNRGRPGGKG
ncbi:hypothetical protein EV191_105191 [Tamaricihabitans halophyticus]|uniref:Uncharacterized protein n=1 Tax=Tamaricihabitans halophyticus TaxID=1262583 RepID=A0A4R2QW44_9PSEU|nr:hypothetical protein [Tamaricihabitans halophyticus]TCP53128.1 hypothetical protein EV191_105191 [Tamaricihabitans halophyticus]